MYYQVIINSENITTPYFDVYGIPSTNVFVVQVHRTNLPKTDSYCAHACDAQVRYLMTLLRKIFVMEFVYTFLPSIACVCVYSPTNL